MKTWIGTICVLVMSIALGCSGIVHMKDGTRTVTRIELENNTESLFKETRGRGFIVMFNKGERIPVELLTVLPFAKLNGGENFLEFTRDTHVFFSSEGVYVSPDGIRFAPVDNPKSVNRLFGATEGYLSVGMAVTEEAGAQIKVSLQSTQD